MNIILFQRDLRIHDNKALNNIIKDVDNFYPLYIFDLDNRKHFSIHSFNFLIESLIDLNNELIKHGSKLYYLNSIEDLEKIKNINSIYFNNNYSPYFIYLSSYLKQRYNCITYDDDCLFNDYELFLKKDKTAYSVFGSYLLNAKKQKVLIPETKKLNFKRQESIKSLLTFSNYKYKINNDERIIGGRNECLKIINSLESNEYYESLTKRCDKQRTSLSPYLKYGCVSIRELYYSFNQEILLNQLNWRNFYMIYAKFIILELYNNETNITKKLFKEVETKYYNHLNPFFKNIKWGNNYEYYKKMWIEAKTGYPIIDASILCLKETGFITNRSRLLLAFFSIKVLHLDPFGIYGGQVEFSKYLIDCCYANNKLNWEFGQSSKFDNTSYRFGKKGTLSGRVYDIETIDAYKKLDPDNEFIDKWLKDKIYIINNERKYKVDKIVNIKSQLEKWYKLTKH